MLSILGGITTGVRAGKASCLTPRDKGYCCVLPWYTSLGERPPFFGALSP